MSSTSVDGVDRSLVPRAAALTILFCFMAALCEGLDIQAAGVAAGGIKRELSPTPGELGVFFAAGNFGLLFGAILGGRLADRLGRKTVLVASIAIFGLCSVLTSFMWNIDSLVVARVLTGLGLGGAMPNLIALVAEVSAARSRNASIAMTYIGMPLGGALASAIILFASVEHWRWVFVSGGVAPLLIVPLMMRFMPDSPLFRAARSSDGAPGETGGVSELFSHARLRHTLILWCGFFLTVLTLHLMLNWLPLLLQGRGLSKNAAAFAQIGFGVGGAAAALGVGAMLDTHWRRLSIAVTALVLPVTLLLLANVPARTEWMFGLALLLGGGILASQVILYGAAGLCYPPAVRGIGIGAAVGVGRIGSLVGPTFAAVLLSVGRTPTQVLTSVLPIVLLCGVCTVILGWWNVKASMYR